VNIANDHSDMAINIANIALGGFLFVAPWVLGFGQETWAALNAQLSGAVVILLSLLAVVRTYDWEEWLNVMAGLWIMGAPWLLWFEGVPAARWTHVIVGFCITAVAAYELYRLYFMPNEMSSRRGSPK
jgi:hypothetical protein